MKHTPIKAIEQIATIEDRSRAIVFFLFFSRFEYALKRAGYVAASEEAKADWNRYARENPAMFEKILASSAGKAAAFLQSAPPKKQVVTDRRLDWKVDNYSAKFDLERLFTLVRRIRNNLFHGGKFPAGPEEELSRDQRLLDAGLAIMQVCLDQDLRLQSYFLEELL